VEVEEAVEDEEVVALIDSVVRNSNNKEEDGSNQVLQKASSIAEDRERKILLPDTWILLPRASWLANMILAFPSWLVVEPRGTKRMMHSLALRHRNLLTIPSRKARGVSSNHPDIKTTIDLITARCWPML